MGDSVEKQKTEADKMNKWMQCLMNKIEKMDKDNEENRKTNGWIFYFGKFMF